MELSMNHYKYIQYYFPCTREVRNCNTIDFFLHKITFPRVTLKDYLTQAADNTVTILTQLLKSNVSLLQARDLTRNAILKIAKLLKRVENIP